MKRKDVEWLRGLARDGGRCESTVYVNSKTKYKWKCLESHSWEATANDVQQGSWCPYCYGNVTKDLSWLFSIAPDGGKCLSTEYKNAEAKYSWVCSEGHEFTLLRVKPRASARGYKRTSIVCDIVRCMYRT